MEYPAKTTVLAIPRSFTYIFRRHALVLNKYIVSSSNAARSGISVPSGCYFCTYFYIIYNKEMITMATSNYTDGALYIRVSTDKQEELSPDAQKRLLLDYAKKHKILVKEDYIFIENGISGRNAKKRPEFQKMISLAKSKPAPFQTILVWKFSRFARNQEESIVYKSMLKKQCGIDVISTSEPLIEGPFGTLIERIIEWMDEYYSINLSGEVSRGMTEKALRGGYQCTPPLGYKAVGGGNPFLVVPEEAKLVSYIFDQYCNYHKEPTAIARQINEMGIHTKRGGLFERRNITYILQNRFYIGDLEWNGISVAGKHETFISPELFQNAQDLIASTYKPIKRRSVSTCKHWLSGLVKCSICGASLSYAHGNKKYPYFICWKYAKGFHKSTSAIGESRLINGVLEYLEKLLDGQEFSLTYIEKDAPAFTAQDQLKKEMDALLVREERIRFAYETGVDTLEEYKANKERLRSEKERLQKQLNEMEKPDPTSDSKEDFLQKVKTVYDILENENVGNETKGIFIRSIVQEIIYDKEADTLTFRLYSPEKPA